MRLTDRLADELDQTQLQIEAEVAQRIAGITAQVRCGRGTRCCVSCGMEIPALRRTTVPNAIRCIACQRILERPK
ncbi:MAG: molecular chaperone DnaK [Gammaproteobacteria bacterium]|nr:molecular chaperone DnaK [Gammaproteobacteria bacterium]